MARPVRPASESYSVCCSVGDSVSYSSEVGLVDEEDDRAPIFSLSKSSMDVMAAGPPHKRDPAWTRLDMRRSSSTNTHSEQDALTLQQLQPHMWQHTNTNRLPFTTQNVDMHSPPPLSERLISNMQRWSGCSGSTHSRSSTPDTIIWKGGSSDSSSLSQVAPSSAAPDSPMSKLTSPPTTPSLFTSPQHMPKLPPVDLLSPSSSTQTPDTHKPEDLLKSSPLTSPLHNQSSPPFQSSSPNLLQLTSTEEEGFLENNLHLFQFPSPIPSSDSLAEEGVSSDPRCLVDDVIEKLASPRGMQLMDNEGARSPVQTFSYMMPNSPAEGKESQGGGSVCHLEPPWRIEQSCPTDRSRRSPIVSSLSDSRLGYCCRCNMNTREGVAKITAFREEATMTSQLDLIDAAVQTASPIGSWWDLRRNVSAHHMGSHSLLGSPPGSRLNLRFSVGSHSNLVSPSSSMFPVSSGEENDEEVQRQEGDPERDVASPSLQNWERRRRRSCLKMQSEEKNGMGGRRSSMKQVQWDEDGMTWDIHGASVDPEELSSAIQKHLEHQYSPRPQKRPSKKKRAPKPPIISNVVTAMVPSMIPPVMVITSEGHSKREVEHEGESKKKEREDVPHRRSRAAADIVKEEEEEVYGEEGIIHSMSDSHGSRHSRKKSVIRSLRRPGWCGGSKKADN